MLLYIVSVYDTTHMYYSIPMGYIHWLCLSMLHCQCYSSTDHVHNTLYDVDIHVYNVSITDNTVIRIVNGKNHQHTCTCTCTLYTNTGQIQVAIYIVCLCKVIC